MRITAKDSVCLIVDYQEKILPAIADRERLIENSVKLLQGLRILGIPLVMTAQYSKGLGVNIPPICEAAGMEKFSDKKTFSSAGCQEVLEAVKDKKYVIICGIEAHVCVLQTVIDLKEMGYQPVLVEDKEIALLRARDEGALLTTSESILFELTVTAEHEQFKQISKLVK